MSKNLLFVDDENQILKAIRRLSLDTDFTVYTADSGEVALQMLDDVKIDLIVVDMRMPVMDGYELLQRVKHKHPSVIRLILSGYAEEKLIINALQNNLARIYLFKPWENKILVRTLEQALAVDELLNSERINNSLSFIQQNPLLRDLVTEIDNSFKRNCSMQRLIKRVIDTGTQENSVFSIINSSFWEVKLDTVEEAQNRFGEPCIKNIIHFDELFRILRKANRGGRIESALEYAVLSNKIADAIYQNLLNKNLNEMNALAGLMHGIGKLVYHEMTSILPEGMNRIEASYQELGGFILSKYELPYPVIETALFHHIPSDSRIINKEIVAVVHLASCYAAALTGEGHVCGIDEGVFDILDFSKKDLDYLIDEIMPDDRTRKEAVAY